VSANVSWQCCRPRQNVRHHRFRRVIGCRHPSPCGSDRRQPEVITFDDFVSVLRRLDHHDTLTLFCTSFPFPSSPTSFVAQLPHGPTFERNQLRSSVACLQ
jgi:hypothetical protein